MTCPTCHGRGGTITPRQTDDGRTIGSHDECHACDGTGSVTPARNRHRLQEPHSMRLAPDDPRHGTYAGYQQLCRCPDCLHARADYVSAARRRGIIYRSRADSDDPYDSTDPIGHTYGHPEWMATAPCVGLTAMFFPLKGETANAAKAVCRTCPLQAACLDYAIDHGIRHGIWGGVTERARRRIRKVRAEAAA